MKHAARFVGCGLLGALVALGTGCGYGSDEESDPEGSGGSGSGGSGGSASDGNGTQSTSGPSTSADCDGAFTTIDAPYAANTSITESFGIAIHRIEFGEALEVVEDQGGMPMVIDRNSIYYNGYEGFVEASLYFDDSCLISEGGGRGIYAIAVSDSSVWYAVKNCI